MNTRQRILLPFIATVLAAPAMAQASSLWHLPSGEAGFITQPEHLVSTRSRADVVAEVMAAQKNGTLSLIRLYGPMQGRAAEPSKTRQQVIDELNGESPEARSVRLALMPGG